jgi:hypothetical protein
MGEENSLNYVREQYANQYELNPNQLLIEDLDYASNNAIKQKTARLKISAVVGSNLYFGSKELSFNFKPTLQAVIPNVEDIAIASSLYTSNISTEQVATAVFTANSETLLSSKELMDNADIVYNGTASPKTFTIAPKDDSVFFPGQGSQETTGTVFDDYKRIP